MGLTGRPLLAVLAVATVLLPIALLVTWSRMRGPRIVRGLAGFALLIAGQLATVALVGALVNDYGQFYTSWSDLLGIGGKPPAVAFYGAAAGAPHHHDDLADAPRMVIPASQPTASGHLQLLQPTSWSTRPQWHTRGEVISGNITGIGSGISTPVEVYLPPQYFLPQYAHDRFPAIEVLTGYPGSEPSLVSVMNYPGHALALVQHQKASPAIYVMLSSTVAPPRDTECTNIPNGPQAQTFLSREVTSAVDNRLRTEPGHWGIIGDSTGGYCAAKLTMLNPSVYAGGVSLSGYYHALPGGTAGNLFNGSVRLQHQNDLRWLLKHRPAPPASLMVTISEQETYAPEGYPETMRFLHLVKSPMQVTALIEKTGGHNFYVWDRELPQALSWLSGRVNAPVSPKAHHHWHVL